MIELMLEAERALAIGLLDNAERLYGQVVAHDPKNAIAVTGLARVALERGDQPGAYTFARRALALDPDNPMASHLAMRMAEQIRNRGEALPVDVGAHPGLRGPLPSLPSGHASIAPDGPPSTHPAGPGLVSRLFRRRR